MKLTRRDFTKAGLAAGALASFGRAPAFAQNNVLKIGVILPRSGLLAQAGQACQRGAALAPQILESLGMKVEIMAADTESNADTARARAEKLIADGAQLLIGAFDSGHTIAVAQVCEQKGVPLLINIGAAPQLTEQGYKTVFRNFATSPMLVKNGLALMNDLFDATGKAPKTAVFLYANDTFGQANKAAIDAILPGVKVPFQLVDSISYDPRAQDLSVEVAKAKASGADIAIVTTRATDAINMVKEAVKQRWEPMAFVSPGSPGMYDEQFYKALGKYADFAVNNVPWIDPTTDLSKKLKAAFEKQYPNDRYDGYLFNVGFTFEAILIAADAAKRAGSTDPKALIEALRQTNLVDHVTIGGPIKFDEKGQNPNIVSACVQNIGGRPQVVLPTKSAEAKPVFPVPGWQARG